MGQNGVIVVMRHEEDTEQGDRPLVKEARERLRRRRRKIESEIGGFFHKAITSLALRCQETGKLLCGLHIPQEDCEWLGKFASFPPGVKLMAAQEGIDTSVAFFRQCGIEEGLQLMLAGGGQDYIDEVRALARRITLGDRILLVGHGGSIDCLVHHSCSWPEEEGYGYTVDHVIQKGEGLILRVEQGVPVFDGFIRQE